MGRSHWRVDPDHPYGYLVPFTTAEEAQAERDAAEAGGRAQAQQSERDALLARLDSPDVTVQEVAQVVKRLLAALG